MTGLADTALDFKPVMNDPANDSCHGRGAMIDNGPLTFAKPFSVIVAASHRKPKFDPALWWQAVVFATA